MSLEIQVPDFAAAKFESGGKVIVPELVFPAVEFSLRAADLGDSRSTFA
jgi:hypothetical protein